MEIAENYQEVKKITDLLNPADFIFVTFCDKYTIHEAYTTVVDFHHFYPWIWIVSVAIDSCANVSMSLIMNSFNWNRQQKTERNQNDFNTLESDVSFAIGHVAMMVCLIWSVA